MTKPLPLGVPEIAGESATSLAARLARRNGVGRLIAFCSDMDVDYFALTNGETVDVERIANLAGISPTNLIAHTPRLVRKRWFQLGTQEVKFNAFQRTRPTVCPICVAENSEKTGAPQAGHFQVSAIRVCPLHKCVLQVLPKAPSTKDHFDIANLALTHRFEEPEFVPVNLLDLQTYLIRRIEFGVGASWLDQQAFHVAAMTCEALGLLLEFGPKKVRANTLPAEWLVAGSTGYKILQAGPAEIAQCLQKLEDDHHFDGTMHGVRFGTFFGWLRDRDDDPHFDEIRKLVREFILSTYPVPEGSLILGESAGRQKIHSVRTLRKVSKVDETPLRYVLHKRGFLKLDKGRGMQSTSFIREKDANEIISEASSLLNEKRVSMSLKAPIATVQQLTKSGHLRPVFNYPRAKNYYEHTAVANFKRSITHNWKPHRKAPDQAMRVPIRRAAEVLGIEIGAVIAFIIDARISVTTPKRDAYGIARFFINPNAVKRASSQQRRLYVSVAEAAEKLGTTKDIVRCLAEHNYLRFDPVHLRQKKNSRKRIGGIQAFLSTHGSIEEFSFENECSVADLPSRLKEIDQSYRLPK